MQRHIVVLIISCLAGFLPSPRAQRPDFYDLSTLRTVELTFSQADWYQQLVANRTAKRYIKADLKVDGQVFKDIGIRFRGNSSYWGLPSASKKRMFKISIDNFVPDRKLYGYKTLNFNNNFLDPAMVREVVGYSIFRKYLPAPKSNYIKLMIKAPGVTNSNWGPYINTEQINKDMLRDWFPGNDGNRYRGERTNLGSNQSRTALTWQGANSSAYSPYYELKNAATSGAWKDIITVCNDLNNSTLAQRPQVLPKVLDVDNVLWFHSTASIIYWLDSYIGRYVHNFYLYTDEFHGRMSAMPWDTNGVFGGYTDGQRSPTTLTPWYHETNVNRPLFSKLMQVPKWRERYLSHIRTILEQEYRWDVIGPKIAACQNLIRAEMQKDPHRLYTMQQFADGVTKELTIRSGWFSSRIPGMKPFLDARRAYLLGRADVKAAAPTLSNLMLNPAKPDPTQQAWVTAKISKGSRAATLYWRVKGPYIEAPMFDDGKHRDGKPNDGVYGAAIGPQAPASRVEYYVSATSPAPSNSMTFLPRTTGTRPPFYQVQWPSRPSPITINELVAKNETGHKDSNGEYEDWFELHNSSSNTVSISGMYLTDDISKPTKWKIPTGQTIAPGGTKLIWADEDAKQGPLHANFQLSASGESIRLFDRDGKTQFDIIEFGPQDIDTATGRLYDGKSPWVTLPVPTPQKLNASSGCGVRLYSARDTRSERLRLGWVGPPKIGSTISLTMKGAAPNKQVYLFTGSRGGHIPLALDIVLLMSQGVAGPVLLPTNSSGAFSFAIALPNDPLLVGKTLYMQTLGPDQGGFSASNALEVTFCAR